LSPMKSIYIIRHGQTDYNLRGIVQGSGVNAPLNERGQQQAQAFYRHFKSVPFDKVYTSKLMRTYQSVQPFIDYTPHEAYEELNEISWGDHEGKNVNYYDQSVFSALTSSWKRGELDRALSNGESPNEVAARQRRFVPVLQERLEEKNVLICMHGRAMRVFLCVLLGLPLVEMDQFEHSNLCLYQLEMTQSRGFKVLKSNYTAHLEDR